MMFMQIEEQKTKKKDMGMNEYQAAAQRTSSKTADKVLNGCMGLCGEAGECIDILKKHLMQGHPLDREKLIEEAGDCLWYVAELATGLGISLGDMAKRNVDKLKARYPEGFSAERSINRQ